MVLAGDTAAPCSCENCGWKGTAAALEMISDFEDRVSAGETVPAGQCPECGALAHLDTAPAWSADALLSRANDLFREAVDAWPQFDGDDAVSGADLVEWFAEWRGRVKAQLGGAIASPLVTQPTFGAVTVATFTHKHGVDTRVFATADAAELWRQEIAKEYWRDFMNEDAPTDPVAMADRYFERGNELGDEFFAAEQCPVEGPSPSLDSQLAIDARALLIEIDAARGKPIDGGTVLDPLHPICAFAEHLSETLKGVPANEQSRPILAVICDGGLVQGLVSTRPAVFGDVLVIDYDTEGAGGKDVMDVNQGDGTYAEACVSLRSVEAAAIDLPQVILDLVRQSSEDSVAP